MSRATYMPTPAGDPNDASLLLSLLFRSTPKFAYSSSLLISCASDDYDYMWNVAFAEHCALAFWAFIESCRFEVPASLLNNPHMLTVKYFDLGILYTSPSQVCDSSSIMGYSVCWSLSLSAPWSVPWLHVRR